MGYPGEKGADGRRPIGRPGPKVRFDQIKLIVVCNKIIANKCINFRVNVELEVEQDQLVTQERTAESAFKARKACKEKVSGCLSLTYRF